MGQLLVVEQSRLKEIQTLAHPELIPDLSPRLEREKKTTDGRVGGEIWDQLC